MRKIRRRWLARVLEITDRTLDSERLPGATFLHETARRAIGAGIVELAERLLNRPPRGLRAVLRHSSTEPRQFNIVQSDVDLAVLSQENVTPELIGRITRVHARMGRWIPWLGELEIYTAAEWELRTELAREFSPALELLWLLRKWRWQQESLKTAPTGYHRAKAARSLAGIRRKLGARDESDLAAVIAERLAESGLAPKRTSPSNPISPGYSRFLGWEIAGADDKTPVSPTVPRLRLPADLAVAFVSLLPDAELCLTDHAADIARNRQDTRLARTHAAVCACEALLCASHYRVHRGDSVIPEWIERLGRMIVSFDPTLAARWSRLEGLWSKGLG